MPLTIREAVIDDAETIVRFNRLMARETEEKEIDAVRLRRGVERGIVRPDLCRYFLAEDDGRVVGQAMVTFEWSDWRDGAFWWLQSVYVDGGHRRRGVFRAIYRHIETLAQATPDVCGLRLYVERNNEPARATYDVLGMANAGYLVYEDDWSKTSP